MKLFVRRVVPFESGAILHGQFEGVRFVINE